MSQKEMRFLAGAQPGWQSANPLQNVVMRSLTETGGWSVEAMRRPGFRYLEGIETDGFRTLAPMPDRAQVLLDRAVVEVGLQRLTIAADILAAGLTYPLSDPLSVAQLEWNTTNKIGAAQRTMNPQSRGENKMPIVSPNRLPIYLTTDEFEIDIRTLKTSQRVGMPLDTAIVKQCVRAVNEAIEDAVINGATTLDGQDLKVAGYSAPGLLNAPNAETAALTLASWVTTPAGGTIFSQVQGMIALLQANKKYGPYRLYVPTSVGLAFDADYNATNNAQGLTIRQRLLQIEGLQAIKTADMLPATKVVLVQMTSDVIDMVVGQPPTIIPWTSLDGFSIHNLVMAIMIPRVRSDYNGDSGIAVGTLA
jgi:uncharacterized linocin/CFP29 family protein